MVSLSNYLIAVGSFSKIRELESVFLRESTEHEITIRELNKNHSIMIIEKTSSSSNDKKSNHFFKGWFTDPKSESVVIGHEGFSYWFQQHGIPPSGPKSVFHGSYVCSIWDEKRLQLENDLFSMFPVIYFSEPDIFVASDSLYVLAHCRRILNFDTSHNKSVLHARAWTHGLACASPSTQTQVSGIHHLIPGQKILLNISEEQIHFKLEVQNVREVFAKTDQTYQESLKQYLTNTYRTLFALSQRPETEIELALSGGLDSRLMLALLLKLKQKTTNMYFVTNNHASRSGDFEIVKSLSKQFGFEFNNRGLRKEGREMVSQNTLEKKFSMWKLSCMGMFDMMYFNGDFPLHATVVRLGGHGAEVVKGTFLKNNFNRLLRNKKVSKKALFSRSVFSHIRKTKRQNYRLSSVRETIRSSLSIAGEEMGDEAMMWHHLCYKSAIANSRYLANSILGYRPLIDGDLFRCARSQPSHDAQIIRDVLILTSPELAAHPFENPKYDMSPSQIKERLELLSVTVDFEELTPFTLYSGDEPITNGPPMSFLNLVNVPSKSYSSPEVMIKSMLDEVWEKLKSKELKEIYQPAYDLAKERFSQEKVYFPSAATPAAKIISLALTENELFEIGI